MSLAERPPRAMVREVVAVYRRPWCKAPSRISSSRDVAATLRAIIPDAPQEVFVVLLLNAGTDLIGWTEVARGGLNSVSVDVGAVFRTAICAGAYSIVLGHNHPHGDPTLSTADVKLTERLEKAGEILGVRVLDHVVIAHNGGWRSFQEHARVEQIEARA